MVPGFLAVMAEITIQLNKSGAPAFGSTILTLDTTAPFTCVGGSVITGTANLASLSNSHDQDGDGCSDWEELGNTDPPGTPGPQHLGGLRDPFNPGDFYDVIGPGGGPKDKYVDLPNDILGVQLKYGLHAGDPGYSAAYDRGTGVGPNPWNITPADGAIDLANDILGVAFQYQHSCQAAP